MTNRTELAQLQKLTLESHLDELARLPEPEQSALTHATAKTLARTARHFVPLWMSLCSSFFPDGVMRVRKASKGITVDLPSEELWGQVLYNVGVYTDLIIRRLLDLVPVGSRNDESIPGLALPHHDQWLPSPDPSEARDEELVHQKLAELQASDQLDAQVNHQDLRLIKTVMANARRQTLHTNAGLVAAAYLSSMNCAALVQASNMLNMPISMVRPTEYFGHKCMADLNRWSLMKLDIQHGIRPNKHLENLTKHLLGSSLSFWTQVYDETQASWDRKHRIGVFSSIRLPELDLLARRDSSVLKKYGAKRVEKIFEQQLALIAQSLGLYVVSTRTGERTVDLICISSDPTVRLSFLLEAKTTQRPYSLPRDDARALAEYVQEVRRALTTLPPLQFVLIVGPAASSTLSKKLQQLEIEIGLPVRFCTAHDIAQLRELIAGPLPLSELVQRIQLGPWILPANFVEGIHTRHEQVHETYERFVRSMLSTRSLSWS